MQNNDSKKPIDYRNSREKNLNFPPRLNLFNVIAEIFQSLKKNSINPSAHRIKIRFCCLPGRRDNIL